jgi:hypothetical protein
VIHSFVLFIPDGIEPPDLPWAHECTPDNPKAARWQRVDDQVHGDKQVMGPSLYGLVVLGRDPQGVIDAFYNWARRREDGDVLEAVLLLHRHGSKSCETYSSVYGSPRLLAHARQRGSGGLV